jgi:Txe/YoeB family toxin of toxin-antitoxin system
MGFKLQYSKQAKKDLKRLLRSPYGKKFKQLLKIIQNNPYDDHPPLESLIGFLHYSRRINIQHRLVYGVDDEKQLITILSCWTHYHEN